MLYSRLVGLILLAFGLDDALSVFFVGYLFDGLDTAAHSPAAVLVGYFAKIVRANAAHLV